MPKIIRTLCKRLRFCRRLSPICCNDSDKLRPKKVVRRTDRQPSYYQLVMLGSCFNVYIVLSSNNVSACFKDEKIPRSVYFLLSKKYFRTNYKYKFVAVNNSYLTPSIVPFVQINKKTYSLLSEI